MAAALVALMTLLAETAQLLPVCCSMPRCSKYELINALPQHTGGRGARSETAAHRRRRVTAWRPCAPIESKSCPCLTATTVGISFS
jgi:hypothetical protein